MSDDLIEEELNWFAEDFPLNEKEKPSKHTRNVKTYAEDRAEKRKLEVKEKDVPVKESRMSENSKSAAVLSERLLQLEERDKLLRSSLEKPSTLKTATSNRGTCPDMCPEKERLMRDLKKIVHPFECASASGQMDPGLAVKEYSRSSADQEEPLPHELRPEPVLSMTMAHLVNRIMCRIDDSEDNLAGWYDFCWDRLRAVRKDIVQQELCDLETVAIVEQCARFHITCFDRFWSMDISVFDEKINTENLMNCLKILMDMYGDLQKHGIVCPNEPEFVAYMIILKLNSGDLLWEYLNFPLSLQQAVEVIEAVKIHTSFHNNVYSQYFRHVMKTSYLNACLMQRFFNHVRINALQTIVKAYCPPNKLSKVSVQHIMKSLKFDNSEDTVSFCEACGVVLGDHLDLRISRNKFTRPDPTFKITTPSSLVTNKRIPFSQAVVGVNNPLPPDLPHTVHDSFIGETTLSKDALDASDQEEKMLLDNIKRKLMIKNLSTRAKSVDSAQSSPPVLPQPTVTLSRNSSIYSSMSELASKDDAPEDVPTADSPEPVEFQLSQSSTDEEFDSLDLDVDMPDEDKAEEDITEDIKPEETHVSETLLTFQTQEPDIELEVKPIERTVTPKFTKPPPFKIPTPPSDLYKNLFSPGLDKVKITKFETNLKSPKLVSPEKIQPPFLIKSPVEKVTKREEAPLEDVMLVKLKSNLRERLKRISARKFGRIWREKVRALKRANTFTPVIHHMDVYDYLNVWGHSVPKKNTILSRVTNNRKLDSLVNNLLESDVFDTSHAIVKQVGDRVGEILGLKCLQHALKFGNVAQPCPAFWKLVFSVPSGLEVRLNLVSRIKRWCVEAFFSKRKFQMDNISVMMSSSGVVVYTKVEVVEGSGGLEAARNLSALVFLRVPGSESPGETQDRLDRVLLLRNHPVPVQVLNLAPAPDSVLPRDSDLLSVSETSLRTPRTLFDAMTHLARSSYVFTAKTEPLHWFVESLIDRFLDALHENSYNHDGLYNILAAPNNILFLYNSFIVRLKDELIKNYRSNLYGTSIEIRSCIEKSQANYLDDSTTAKLESYLDSLQIKLLMWPPQSSKDMLSIFRSFCTETSTYPILSQVIRMINPPDDDDEEADLTSHLLSLQWLHITEIIIKQYVRQKYTSMNVTYCEKSIKELISSHWWMTSDLVLKFKTNFQTPV